MVFQTIGFVCMNPIPVRLSDGRLNPEYSRNYYTTHKKHQLAKACAYYEKNREKCRKRARERKLEQKIRVLTHYGKGGNLQCCWSECEVTDVDMLTLDHVNNDGAKQRETSGWADQCAWTERHGLPEGYQTLCWNHQWKKELTRRRDEFATLKTRKSRGRSLPEEQCRKISESERKAKQALKVVAGA